MPATVLPARTAEALRRRVGASPLPAYTGGGTSGGRGRDRTADSRTSARRTMPVILCRDGRISARSRAYHPPCLLAAAGLPRTSPDDGAQYTPASGFRAGRIEASLIEAPPGPPTDADVGPGRSRAAVSRTNRLTPAASSTAPGATPPLLAPSPSLTPEPARAHCRTGVFSPPHEGPKGASGPLQGRFRPVAPPRAPGPTVLRPPDSSENPTEHMPRIGKDFTSAPRPRPPVPGRGGGYPGCFFRERGRFAMPSRSKARTMRARRWCSKGALFPGHASFPAHPIP